MQNDAQGKILFAMGAIVIAALSIVHFLAR